MNFSAQGGVLRAHLAAERIERTAQHRPAFFLDFLEVLQAELEVESQPLERWHRRRKDGVKLRTLRLPVSLECCHGQVTL